MLQSLARPLSSGLDITSTQPSAAGFDDYEQERKNFSLPMPTYYNFATDVIDVWAEKEKVS